MKFIQEEIGNNLVIQGYSQGQVIVNGRSYRSSLIITPAEVVPEWRPRRFSDLSEQDITLLIDLQPEMIILGTGASHQFLHPSMTVSAMQRRIGFETMDTAAACRTYNILMAEGRRVVAALLMI